MPQRRRVLSAAASALALPFLAPMAWGAAWSPAEIAELNFDLLFSRGQRLERALAKALERGEADLLATMILGMRYNPDSHKPYLEAFFRLIGVRVAGWHEASAPRCHE